MNIVKSEFAKDVIFSLPSCICESEITVPPSACQLTDFEFDALSVNDIDYLLSSTLFLIYYIAGYIGCNVARRRKCDSCRVLLISDISLSDVDIPHSDILCKIS